MLTELRLAALIDRANVRLLNYSPALDGIRGVAVLAVFFHHALFTAINPADWPAAYQPLIQLSHFGQYGLDLFFVLSGYLITTILIGKKDSPRYFREFYVNRFTRIIPIYAVVLAVVAALVPHSASYVVISVLFVANFAQLFHVTVVGPFWTLAIEEQFYIVWPFLVRGCSRVRLRRIAIGILIAEPLLRLSDIAIGHHNFRFTFFHADGLAFGAVLACQVCRPAQRTVFCALAIGAAFYGLSLFGAADQLLSAVFEALQPTSVGLIAYGLVAGAIGGSTRRAVRWLSLPFLIFFGQISYCFYLIHIYVFMAFDATFGPIQGADPVAALLRLFVVLAATTALCVLSRKFIELPAMSLRRRLA
jgi:peptidoglycan/LPS O-acetylase OafA/YrhL